MPSVLLFGTGGIGSIYLYILSRSGCTVSAVCRSNYTAVKEHGLLINSGNFGKGIRIRPYVFRTPEEASNSETKYDYVVVCSKAFPGSKPSTAEILKPAIAAKTTIVLIQNGMGIEDEYRDLFPSNPILSCAVYLPVTQTSPGVISMGDFDFLELGTFPSDAPPDHKKSAHAFAELVKAGGGTVDVFDDVQERRYRKLLVNCSWNPLCALSKRSDREFMDSSEYATEVVLSVMLEVVTLAQAMGYKDITEETARGQLARAQSRTVGIEPSMLADVRNGRRIEVEAILGNVVRVAREKKVVLPGLEMLYVLAKAMDSANQTEA